MPNSRHTSVMLSPSSRRATKRRRSSITELAVHGINTSRQMAKTHVSGTKCHLSLRPLIKSLNENAAERSENMRSAVRSACDWRATNRPPVASPRRRGIGAVFDPEAGRFRPAPSRSGLGAGI